MKSTMSVLMAMVIALSFLFAAGVEAQQPKSDLPEGWEEPLEVPAGAIRLEDVRPSGAPPEAAPPPAAPEAAPVAPPPAPPEAVTEAKPAAPEAPPLPAAEVGPPEYGSDSRSQPVDWRFAPPEATGAPAEPTVAEEAPPPAPVIGEAAAGERVYEPRSDLPEGWQEPVMVPPGAIRLEDVKSPYGPPPAAPPAEPRPAYAPPAAPPPPTPTPVAPEPEYIPPPAPPPPPEVEEAKEEKPYRPPSRWQQ